MRVMAGLIPTTPIMWHDCAKVIGVAGTSPAMTPERWRANETYVFSALFAGANSARILSVSSPSAGTAP
jgi:hypothetical protein